MSVSVNIKMYRVGELGDCFLLRFTNGQEKSHVLIDCGSFRNGNKSKDRMKAIAADIKAKLGTDSLNVVAGTHQHNDHLSGFIHAQKTFNEIKPEQIWLSWLDDPDNKQAVNIGKDYNNYLTQLRLIHQQLQSNAFKGNTVKDKVAEILGFFGVADVSNKLNAKTDKLPPDLPAQAVEILRKLGKKAPKYLSPGEVFNLPGLSDNAVKVYVLGPPQNEDLLYDKNPGKDETFDHKLALKSTQATKLLGALKNINHGGTGKTEDEPYPFNEPYRKSENYDAVWNSYYKKDNAWRQIDEDWLNHAEQLALWLDGYTNNSSLVLAFEIVKSNKVLLFAADAQTGNWNSWKEVKWKKMPKDFNWLTLMRNTVLYKTGHHGSHNSTLVEGLKNMTHDELVVLIPVDKTDKNIDRVKGWKMPAENLLKELEKRSQNRIIRMDDGISKAKAWDKLPHKPAVTELYCEYEIKE
jgi:hypothetical protein